MYWLRRPAMACCVLFFSGTRRLRVWYFSWLRFQHEHQRLTILRFGQQVGGDVRLTRVYKKFGTEWRAIATHASLVRPEENTWPSNQSMKTTPKAFANRLVPLRNKFILFATTTCRRLSLFR